MCSAVNVHWCMEDHSCDLLDAINYLYHFNISTQQFEILICLAVYLLLTVVWLWRCLGAGGGKGTEDAGSNMGSWTMFWGCPSSWMYKNVHKRSGFLLFFSDFTLESARCADPPPGWGWGEGAGGFELWVDVASGKVGPKCSLPVRGLLWVGGREGGRKGGRVSWWVSSFSLWCVPSIIVCQHQGTHVRKASDVDYSNPSPSSSSGPCAK